ncbi:hypothetical protein [Saccharopolyspora phatthalungensis]|uniref:Uncharacterized protein n=1 Tax=Saccharopolyspora phatthalungensis TaxID=664693 RepID=A0A840QJ35_9PSEU|nr:hypothetical protein [Saccharopolyspora phatthalungensis]MBB5157573.1 hypothetical protein [Saccharopolyspora phatthalungensis]
MLDTEENSSVGISSLSANAWDLYASTASETHDRYRGLEARIAAERPDIVAIQRRTTKTRLTWSRRSASTSQNG